jgi:hypothetical protein
MLGEDRFGGTAGYRERLYVGVSEAEQDSEGKVIKPATLDEAFEDAWQQAMRDDVPPGTRMHVLDFEFYGKQPIDMYRVVVKVDI